ncbi:MAG: calcium/sodium antiporter, partial [bacterium]
MSILLDILIVCLSIAVVARGAFWLVDSAARIAKSFGVSELVIGLTVVAFGTSVPEFAVTILAAVRKMGDISVGNIVGSNIFNLGFILGLCAIVRPIRVTRKAVTRDGLFLIGVTVLLVTLMTDFGVGRLEGLGLMLLLALYVGLLGARPKEVQIEGRLEKARWKDGLLLLLGLACVLVGSHFMVSSAVTIARAVGISNWAVAVTVVAFGTSVPELATSLVATTRGYHGISAGNLIGSDLFNLLGVLGLAAFIRPLSVAPESRISILILVGVVTLVVILMRSGWRVS